MSDDLADRNRASTAVPLATEHPRPLLLTACLAAGWSAGAGLVLCVCVAVIGWFAGSAGGVLDAVRVGAVGWLLGQGGGLHAGAATVTAVPLGLTALSAALLWRSGRWAAWEARVADARGVATGTAAVVIGFAMVASAAAALANTNTAGVSPTRAFLSAALLAGVFSGLGMLSGAGQLAIIERWLPDEVTAGLHGALVGALAMLAAGTVLVTLSLTADFVVAADLMRAMDAGAMGCAILTLVGVLLLPNASLLAVAYLLGPGFAVGSGSVVSTSGVTLGQLPTFPLVAALPADGVVPDWALALVGVPVLAGVLVGVVAVRSRPVAGLDYAALRGSLGGLLAGAATGALTGLAGGAVGPGRMSETGAPVLECIASGGVAMGLGGVVGGVLAAWLARRAERSNQPSP